MSQALKRLIFYPMWWLRSIAQGLLILISIASSLVGILFVAGALIEGGQLPHPWLIWLYAGLAFVIVFASYGLRMNYYTLLDKLTPDTGLPAPHFSPKVYQLGQEYELGTPVARYRGKLVTRSSGIWMVLAVFYAGLLIWALLNSLSRTPPLWSIISTTLLLIPALWFIIYRVRRLFWRVYVFTNGCAYIKNGRPYPFAWEEVDTIWQDIRHTFLNGSLFNTTHKYTLSFNTQEQIVFDDNLQEIDELGNTLQTSITTAKLPHILSTYKKGEVVTFGPLSISQQGMSFKPSRGTASRQAASSEEQHLSWDQIKNVEVNNGGVWVSQHDKQKSLAASVAAIPNFFAFIALIRFAQEGRS